MTIDKSIGQSIRMHRNSLHWSQAQLARKVALSQKQLSRIEQSQVLDISRDLLVTIARTLKEPLVSGELNQWLYKSGYRPYVAPLLDLPAEYLEWIRRFNPFPAALLDIGWYLRFWNDTTGRLFGIPFGALDGLNSNLAVLLYAPDSPLAEWWPPELLAHMLNRLLVQWQPYATESWLHHLKSLLQHRIGMTWEELAEQYCPSPATIPSTSEILSFRAQSDIKRLRFRSNLVPVPNRPDLVITHYYPLDDYTERWCWQPAGRTLLPESEENTHVSK